MDYMNQKLDTKIVKAGNRVLDNCLTSCLLLFLNKELLSSPSISLASFSVARWSDMRLSKCRICWMFNSILMPEYHWRFLITPRRKTRRHIITWRSWVLSYLASSTNSSCSSCRNPSCRNFPCYGHVINPSQYFMWCLSATVLVAITWPSEINDDVVNDTIIKIENLYYDEIGSKTK